MNSREPIIPARLTGNTYPAASGTRGARYELIDGVPVKMADGNRRRARITANLIWRLKVLLQGSSCEPFGSDIALEVSPITFRQPVAAIYFDPRDLGPTDLEPTSFRYPKVVFEILPGAVRGPDHIFKLDEYQRLPSVDTIVFIHSNRDAFTTYERAGENEWRTIVHLPGEPLRLRDPVVEIGAAEIFGGV
jgi:Uma2 family endonuclease